MKVLLVKTSSMGDVIHTLPAVTDAVRAVDGLKIDWVVEESFCEIPSWHPGCRRVIPLALRRWAKNPIKAVYSGEWRRFLSALREESYDKIIDAQGLLKSGWISSLAKGPRFGLDRSSIKESPATLFYQYAFSIPKGVHAVQRTRQLFAKSLEYGLPDSDPDPGLDAASFQKFPQDERHVIFLHGASKKNKTLYEEFWIGLAELAARDGLAVYLPWGTSAEKQRAEQIAEEGKARVLPRMNLTELAQVLCRAKGVVGLDTGLSHLAAALKIPSVTLFVGSSPDLTGAMGPVQINLRVKNSRQTFTPEQVWSKLKEVIHDF